MFPEDVRVKPATTEWIVIRQVSSDELSIASIPFGFRPAAQPGYTWGGPYPTKRAASTALWRKCEQLRQQLYPESTKTEAKMSGKMSGPDDIRKWLSNGTNMGNESAADLDALANWIKDDPEHPPWGEDWTFYLNDLDLDRILTGLGR